MAEVLSIQPGRNDDVQLGPREIRNEYGLSLLEAASALGISAAAVEELERGRTEPLGGEALRRKYELFIGTTDAGVGKNLIFGSYPLRVARELLEISLDEMAAKFGYTANSWKRIEANARPLSPELLRNIEKEVRDKLATVCALYA